MKKLLRVFGIIFLFFSLRASSTTLHSAPFFRFFFWSNLWGETEPCECVLRPLGGLENRLKKIKELSSQLPDPSFALQKVFYVDGGRSLAGGWNLRDLEKRKSQALMILQRTTEVLGDWILLMGEEDLEIFPELSWTLESPQRVLSNVEWKKSFFQRSQKNLPFRSYLKFEGPRSRIWFFSFVSQKSRLPKYQVRDPQRVLAQMIRERGVLESDVVVIGGSLDYDEIYELSQSQKNRKLIFVGGKFSGLRLQPLSIENYLYFFNEAEGKNFWSMDFKGASPSFEMKAQLHQVFRGKETAP